MLQWRIAARLATCISFLTAPTAIAAELNLSGSSSGDAMCPVFAPAKMCITFTLTGAIVPGDAGRLEWRIGRLAKMDGLPMRIGVLHLDSNGGDMYEAMKIADVVRRNRIQTIVQLGASCHSACVLVLAGGVARYPVGKVGVHSFYSKTMTKPGFDYQQEEARYQRIADDVRAFLLRMRVSANVLDEMIGTPPTHLKVLEFPALQKLGLFGIDPLFHQLLINQGYAKPPK